MGNCCSAPGEQRVDMNHVDLQAVFEKYVWNVLSPVRLGKCRSLCVKRKNYVVEVKWEYLEKVCETHFPNVTAVKEEVPVVLHKAAFDNTSGKDQTFSFNTIKETKAISTFSFSEVFSIGSKYSIGIKLPFDISFGAELTGNYSVTEGKTQSFENRIQWDMHSEITVEDNTSAEAVMKAHEETTSQPIIVFTKFVFAKSDDQRVPFVVRHKQTGKILFVGDVQVLKAPLEYFYEDRFKMGRMPPMLSFNENPEYVDCDVKKERKNRRDDIIIFKTTGLSKIIAWKNHHITVNKIANHSDHVSNDSGGAQDGQ